MSNSAKSGIVRAAIILAVVLIAYIPAMKAGFVWDDAEHILDNQALRSTEGLTEIWTGIHRLATMQYYPLTFSTFWAQHQLWGDDPFGYHLTNIILHAINAILLWLLLRRLTVPGAWFAGLLFAVHPVHVMSVAWATELKNVLSGLFYLLALHAYFSFAGVEPALQRTPRRWCFYGLAAVAFALALLSKTATCLFPITVLLLLWWKRGRVTSEDFTPVIPLIFLGGGMGMFTLWVETQLVGASGAGFSLPLIERVIIAGRSFWFYLGKLFWPHPLVFFYERWEIDASSVVSYVPPVLAVVLLVLLWALRRRVGRGPFMAMLYFAVAAPFLVIIQVIYMMRYTFVSDHWVYFASPAVMALAAAVGASLLKRAGRIVRVGTAVVLLLGCGILTWTQAGNYRDIETLYQDCLSKNSQCWIAAYNLGVIREEQNRLDEALELYDRAIAIKPDYFEAFNNSGTALVRTGRVDEAIDRWLRCLEIHPGHGKALYNLAGAYLHYGRTSEAIECYKSALLSNPDYDDARKALIDLLVAEGLEDEADRHRQRLGM
ncbi:MAG: tetratricopeptide repeat protein [Verrucomicrobia bacterium]|nr:tetratricopeptide repeat protein [Verrucomicrobiota bacterium]